MESLLFTDTQMLFIHTVADLTGLNPSDAIAKVAQAFCEAEGHLPTEVLFRSLSADERKRVRKFIEEVKTASDLDVF